MKLTLAPLHNLHTWNVTNTSSVTFWMGCSKLEEHLWWIELNVLVLSLDWGWIPSHLWDWWPPVIGSGIAPTWLSLSLVAGVVTLVRGMTSNIDCPFNWLKDEWECELVSPSKFLCCASAWSSKWEGKDLGLIIDLVLLKIELSGNLTQ